jgi:uridylate kinase
MNYKRILVKISGEALQNKSKGLNHDPEILGKVAAQFKQMLDMGAEIAVVVGGGNIFRGLAGAGEGTDRTTGDYMGMLATVINSMAIQSALENAGIQTRVMTAIAMPANAEPFIRRKAMRHLEKAALLFLVQEQATPTLPPIVLPLCVHPKSMPTY